MLTDLEASFTQKMGALRVETKKAFIEALAEVTIEFFARNPRVLALRWTQPGDFWNDERTVDFEINEPEVSLSDDTGTEFFDVKHGYHYGNQDNDSGAYWYSADWDLPKVGLDDLASDLQEFYASLESVRDLVKFALDINQMVTIDRDGTVSMEEYSYY